MMSLAFRPIGRLGRNRGAEHLTGRQLDNAVALDQTLRLRSLAGPRRSQKYQSHTRKPPGSVSDDPAHLLLLNVSPPDRLRQTTASVSGGGP